MDKREFAEALLLHGANCGRLASCTFEEQAGYLVEAQTYSAAMMRGFSELFADRAKLVNALRLIGQLDDLDAIKGIVEGVLPQ